MLEQRSLSAHRPSIQVTMRWLIIGVGLALQIGLVIWLFLHFQQRGQILSPFLGDPRFCHAPSQPASTPGALPSSTSPCRPHLQPPPISPVDIAATALLALVFDLTAIIIFLRARDRATAHIAAALFYAISLMCSIFPHLIHTQPWVYLLFLSLGTVTNGLAATFVGLFPFTYHNTNSSSLSYKRIHPLSLAYFPLWLALLLVFVDASTISLPPHLRFNVYFLSLFYNVFCLLFVVWKLIWGLRNLSKNEQQMARVIMIALIFVLVIAGLAALSILEIGRVTGPALSSRGLLYLVPVPLIVLPIIYDYTLFRHELFGTTSLLGRKGMRVLLWLLLASLFIFPSVILLRVVNGNETNIWSDFLYVALLVISLWLFPLLWNRLRDFGDSIFYHDFYQYNRALQQLSTALTNLRGLDQISNFLLPQLATLLNATEAALFIRATSQGEMRYNSTRSTHDWHIYHHIATASGHDENHLREIADQALVHFDRRSHEPVLLGDVLFLALYDGDQISGFLCLGTKKNREPYDRQDKSFLTTLTAQLAILEVNNRYLAQAQADAHTLTALNHRVISAQEAERRHLALDLHDDVLQEAMLLVRQLSDAGTMSDVADVMPLARTIVTNLRRTCLALRPSLLEDLGLAEALRWLAQQTEQVSNIKIQVQLIDIQVDTAQLYSKEVELAFYRVAQEALANITKHAAARHVTLRLHYHNNGLISLLIADDGRGFRLDERHRESLGIVGMHERMSAVGGTIQLRTSPGHGTIVSATYLPVHAKQPVEANVEQATLSTKNDDRSQMILPQQEELAR